MFMIPVFRFGPPQVIELNLNENKISAISASLAKCPRLKVLRLAHNQLRLEDIPMGILENSNVSIFSVEGNPLSVKALQELPAYAKVRSLISLLFTPPYATDTLS